MQAANNALETAYETRNWDDVPDAIGILEGLIVAEQMLKTGPEGPVQ